MTCLAGFRGILEGTVSRRLKNGYSLTSMGICQSRPGILVLGRGTTVSAAPPVRDTRNPEESGFEVLAVAYRPWDPRTHLG